jgi:hypothetical protein
MKKPPTGEPYAGKPPVRFGGRGGESHPDPYPVFEFRISAQCGCRLIAPYDHGVSPPRRPSRRICSHQADEP